MNTKGPSSSHADLLQYTSGRWLWDEEQQLRDRYSPFNVSELQKAAAASVGAQKCIEITKLAEGSFNKTFQLVMDDGNKVIARIPHPIAGPPRYATASEVATMEFARLILGVPTPQVLAWSSDMTNPVQSEYIIMEEAPGVRLDDVWADLELENKVAIMKDVVSLEKKMSSVSFNQYGSLYYASDNVPGAFPAEIRSGIPARAMDEVARSFLIGPLAERTWWSKERADMEIDRGPWEDPVQYAVSIAQRELNWIQQYAVPKAASDPLVPSQSQNSPTSHISLLQRYSKVARHLLPSDPAVVASHLWQTDLHAGNIFIDVEKNRVSSIIDWQGAWAGPLILQARHPRLVQYEGELILKPPDNFKELEPNGKKLIRQQMSQSIVLYLYEQTLAKQVPLLHSILHFPYGRTRCEPIEFAGDTWDDDIIPLRESLIRIEKHWAEIGLDFPCPFHFTEGEVEAHARDSEGWNEVQDFWESISAIASRDGWTPNEGYDDAIALFRELREMGIRTKQGKELEDFKRRTEWVEKACIKPRVNY
ncbi:kinase-like domain-containing protein [Aspergillus heterothallicus]